MKILLSIFLLLSGIYAQNSFVLKENREKFKIDLISRINSLTTDFLHTGQFDSLDGALWGAGLLFYRSENLSLTLKRILENPSAYPDNLVRAVLETVAACYPSEFSDLLFKINPEVLSVKNFAMQHVYLANSGKSTAILSNRVREKQIAFPGNPILDGLQIYINQLNTIPSPDISGLLNFFYSADIVFSLQYKNRNKPGFVLIKRKSGEFVRDGEAKLVTIPQLARSLSNMPGFLTNGNTPQGIFRITGIDTSANLFIGATPNLQLVLPFEVPPGDFFISTVGKSSEYSTENYLDIAPPQFRGSDSPLLEAYRAGKAGRTEIIAHGTATDVEYYRTREYFPYTPTLGCLCMKEIWSEETGQLLESDQDKFMRYIFQYNIISGYYIVLEVPETVTPETVGEYITP